MGILFSFVLLVALVFTLADIITRDSGDVKHLPKFAWVLLVIFIPLIGIVLWFTLGREYYGSSAPRSPFTAHGRAPVTPQPHTPPAPTTEEQLAELDREIEYYRRRAELEKLKREEEGDATA
ncbi:PLD nuclease N-terminal domain-containing protein [Rathayibacter sp. YIM 133350]|uniref:PLD nuclease N-terminal domain-containing protein n=1 Tax=Rathayibacter sp. YIM 133350 TaxID=3131992 RepID=UPI00307D53C0